MSFDAQIGADLVALCLSLLFGLLLRRFLLGIQFVEIAGDDLLDRLVAQRRGGSVGTDGDSSGPSAVLSL